MCIKEKFAKLPLLLFFFLTPPVSSKLHKRKWKIHCRLLFIYDKCTTFLFLPHPLTIFIIKIHYDLEILVHTCNKMYESEMERRKISLRGASTCNTHTMVNIWEFMDTFRLHIYTNCFCCYYVTNTICKKILYLFSLIRFLFLLSQKHTFTQTQHAAVYE
jgi:hypothetical protein